ncbi:hypothetical protein BH24ACI3_BH24ACI3_15300 [soil metagenome]
MILTDKLKIKIIKKGQAVKTPVNSKIEVKSTRESARDMVSNVSSWVNDFQSRKRGETKMALEQLFAASPQPNES